jgi:retron-type reverse transcriptase
MALNKIQKYIKNENNWIVIGDIESFFDNVNLEILFNLIKKEINDKNLLNLIFKIIKSGEQFNNKGIPQGSVISPIFANIYLNEFDKLIYSKYNLIRYVDDFL